jgi:hypothetical protein
MSAATLACLNPSCQLGCQTPPLRADYVRTRALLDGKLAEAVAEAQAVAADEAPTAEMERARGAVERLRASRAYLQASIAERDATGAWGRLLS